MLLWNATAAYISNLLLTPVAWMYEQNTRHSSSVLVSGLSVTGNFLLASSGAACYTLQKQCKCFFKTVSLWQTKLTAVTLLALYCHLKDDALCTQWSLLVLLSMWIVTNKNGKQLKKMVLKYFIYIRCIYCT